MRKILAVATKEFRQIRRDRLSLAMLLGVPAMMILLYGYALNFDVRHVPLAVQDRDHSARSRQLVEAFLASTYFDLTATPAAGDDLERLTRIGRARAVLVIPERYGVRLNDGAASPAQFIVDGTDSNTGSTILGYASALVTEQNVRMAAEAGVSAGPPLLSYRPRVWYNPELKSSQFLVPGLIGFILMLTGVISTALSVVREKERGTMEQLLVSPLNSWQLLVGKTVPFLVISLAATVIVLVAARALFGVVVKGSYLDLFVATLIYLFGALGFGLFVSTISRDQAQAFQFGAVTAMLPAIFISGFIFPLHSMPAALQVISYAVPARYYLIILRGVILKGASLSVYADQFAFLALYAAAVLALAGARLSRDGGER